MTEIRTRFTREELFSFCEMFPTHNPLTGQAWSTGEGVTLEVGPGLGSETIWIDYGQVSRTIVVHLDPERPTTLPELCARIVCVLWGMKHPPVKN